MLSRQTEALRGLVSAAEQGPLVRFDRVLVVVDQGLVAKLLNGAVPWEATVAGRYRVVITGAEATFEDGFALVRLDGRVSLKASLPTDVFAEVQVFAGLDVVELDPSGGILRGRLSVIAFEARRVELFGRGPVRRGLVEDFGRQRLEAFAELASSLEIPVRLEEAMEIPAVGPDGPVSIPATTVPVRIAVADVDAFHGKLWISFEAEAGEAAACPPGASGPRPPASSPPSAGGSR